MKGIGLDFILLLLKGLANRNHVVNVITVIVFIKKQGENSLRENFEDNLVLI